MKNIVSAVCLLALFACNQKKDQKDSDTIKTDSLTNVAPTDNTPFVASGTDTLFNDLSNRFKVITAAFPDDSSVPGVESINVAVIPVDSIGTVKIPWNDNQQQLTKETEKEFETELMQCKNGKDTTDDVAETKMKKGYCERTGYSDASMGHFALVYYCSFVKENNLVVVELMTNWSSCGAGYETKAERKACETGREKDMKTLDMYMEKFISSLRTRRI